ncbi:uncharacterized protein LOC128546792 [Mercenaria mercenaria]|uniref:uncharacterized protein LOC128546792 n=1 Tax=Mercenaria mercenaria TaxID=6596 RepID=UPI00234E79F4|nr:uncharacterized protein LOC128546792 [Mercenaria mercenaria]
MHATICQLRQRFWIPNIRQAVKSLLRTCVACRKVSSKPYLTPDPPPLPKCRADDSPPFSVTGVNYSEALHVRTGSSKETKAYICLFTCASTRAVHLELVHNLTLESFLQAFRRFTSRRSLTYITSDTLEPEPLTPAHLFHGQRVTTLPYKDVQNEAVNNHNQQNMLKRVRIQQELLQRFWSRWRNDYLTSLRERHANRQQSADDTSRRHCAGAR